MTLYIVYIERYYNTVDICQLGRSISFVYEHMRCNEDSWKTSNMCGERIYVVTRGVHTTNFFINAVIDKYHKSDKVMDDWWKKILNE